MLHVFTFLSLLSFWFFPAPPEKPAKVTIEQKNGNFRLLRNGKPYFIKGAVEHEYLAKLHQYGRNSIRTDSKPEVLDKAHKLGLTALVNLPVRAERDGMDYDNAEAV